MYRTRLTKRQEQVLRLWVVGRSATEIAEELEISRETVRTHLAYIYAELGVERKIEAVIAAIKLGLVTWEALEEGAFEGGGPGG